MNFNELLVYCLWMRRKAARNGWNFHSFLRELLRNNRIRFSFSPFDFAITASSQFSVVLLWLNCQAESSLLLHTHTMNDQIDNLPYSCGTSMEVKQPMRRSDGFWMTLCRIQVNVIEFAIFTRFPQCSRHFFSGQNKTFRAYCQSMSISTSRLCIESRDIK